MIRVTGILLLTILLLPAFAKAQQQNGSVLENRISINLKNQSISTILDQISWQAGVYFSYDASVLNANQLFSVEAENKSLFTVLNQLFDAQEFKFLELENQVIIARNNEKKLPVEIAADSIEIKFFFLTGKIIDGKKKDPIKYATVSVLNKPVGTISNIDGNFLLKIHPDLIRDTIVISCMGYSQIFVPAWKILDDGLIQMNPSSIRLREIKVVSTTPEKLLNNIRENLTANYSDEAMLMTGFYRETIKQDDNYINVSEAVVDILKAPYSNTTRSDDIKIVKGRRSPDVKPFQWINFKLQGGPFTINRLDVVKSLESFIDPEFQHLYNYEVGKTINYNGYPVFVLSFKPTPLNTEMSFIGEIYVHCESFAIVHINFRFSKVGLKNAETVMIKKKPKGVKAKLVDTDYTANYQFYNGKWHLLNLKASVKFKVRSRFDQINSEYQSVSDLLITDIQNTTLKKFERNEIISQRDIFVELIGDYDQHFWENYNIIKPDEDLQNAFKSQITK